MKDKPSPSRRRFLQTTAGAVVSAPYIVPASALGKDDAPPPSERISLGIIGVNGMGRGNLGNGAKHPDVAVTAVCDAWQHRIDPVVAQHQGTAKGHTDYRELLDRADVDAVIIATPPHWHALMAIQAVEAGKDIYLQKPMTLFPDETLAVRNAVNKHGRISQIGTQIHAGANYRRVVEWIRSGKLGPISVARTFNVMNQGPNGLGTAPAQDPPPGLDWNMWLGPGPKSPTTRYWRRTATTTARFSNTRVGGRLEWHRTSLTCPFGRSNWACRLSPIVRADDTWSVAMATHRMLEVVWQYPNMTMTWMMSCCNSFAFDFGRGSPARGLGIYLHGLNGTLFTDYSKHEVVPEGNYLTDATPPEESIAPSPGHEREWLDCVKSREQPSCNVNYHYKVDLALTLANLSYRLGRSVQTDPKTGKIIGDEEAAKLARPVYRDPWKFPAEYLET